MLVTIEKIIIETEVMRVAFLERFFRGLTKYTRDYFIEALLFTLDILPLQNIVFEAK